MPLEALLNAVRMVESELALARHYIGDEPAEVDLVRPAAGHTVTPWNFNNGTCRCDDCRVAWNAYMRERRKARAMAHE
jgi:hypothetical protein